MKNDAYWSRRLADKVFESNTNKMYKTLKKSYTQQAQKVKLSIVELYADMLEDGEISTTNLYKYGRYNALLNEFDKHIGNFSKDEIKVMTEALEEVYIETFEKTSNALGNEVQWGLQNKYMMEEVINANFKGKNFSDRIWDNKRNMVKMLGREVQDVVASGKNKDEAIKIMMDKTGTIFNNCDMLIRTETMRVINDGQKNSYINNGYTKGYYIVADDERLCEECLDWEQRTKENPMLLQDMEGVHHPRCRCTIIPIVE